MEICSSGCSCFEKEREPLVDDGGVSEGEVSDEDQDSSHRLRRLEASWACRRPVDNEMPIQFNRPVQGVTPEQQQATDDIVIQLEDIKTTAPAMYHRLCLQVLRHYRDGRPVQADRGKEQRRNV